LEWPGKVSNVQDYLRKSSVFILPSYREGVPRSTQEAMALGRPIITTNVAGCRETVEVACEALEQNLMVLSGFSGGHCVFASYPNKQITLQKAVWW